MEYFYLSHCRDFRVLSAQLNEDEMEKAEELVRDHELGSCCCDEENDSTCLAFRWLEGLLDTDDFVRELTENRMDKADYVQYIADHFSLSGSSMRLINNILDYVETLDDDFRQGALHDLLSGTIGLTENELRMVKFY